MKSSPRPNIAQTESDNFRYQASERQSIITYHANAVGLALPYNTSASGKSPASQRPHVISENKVITNSASAPTNECFLKDGVVKTHNASINGDKLSKKYERY